MYTSRISVFFALFLLWADAFPFYGALIHRDGDISAPKPQSHHGGYLSAPKAQVQHGESKSAPKHGSRVCRRRLEDVPDFAPPIRPGELPEYFDLPNHRPKKHDLAWIRDTAALYPLAVDGKTFQSLSHVFLPDVKVDLFRGQPIVEGLPLLQRTLRKSLHGLRTHHQLGTLNIYIFNHRCQALTISDFTATMMGTGNSSGKAVTVVGQYQDHWIKATRRTWRISHRNVLYTGPFMGDVAILHN